MATQQNHSDVTMGHNKRSIISSSFFVVFPLFPSTHPSPPQLSLTVYLADTAMSSIQPVSPGNRTGITLAGVFGQEGPEFRASVTSLKALRCSAGHQDDPTVKGQGLSPRLALTATFTLLKGKFDILIFIVIEDIQAFRVIFF